MKKVKKAKNLTFEDRKRLEQMWKSGAPVLKIAVELEVSQCAVYTELKRGRKFDERTGEAVLDRNFRPDYCAERGEMTYQSNLRKRGRRPKNPQVTKGVQKNANQ